MGKILKQYLKQMTKEREAIGDNIPVSPLYTKDQLEFNKMATKLAANYTARLNASPYLLKTEDGIWWEYKPSFFDKVLKRLGLCRKSVLVSVLDFLKEAEKAIMESKDEKTNLIYESILLVEKMLKVK